jgi:phosphate transport system substrate-binding protein
MSPSARHHSLSKSFLLLLSAAPLLIAALPARAQTSDGLALHRARAKALEAGGKGKKAYYTTKWDLSGLPHYKPSVKVTGPIRMWGSNYITDGLLAGYWEEGFKKFHPGVTFDLHMKTAAASMPGLVLGVSDLGPGPRASFSEIMIYQRYFNADPLEILFATGSYDVTGWNPSFGIVVNKDNPLTKITMEQLDGLYGAERTGGWVGTSWHPEFARGPEKNIRTWGQLGLTGDWANKPIIPYGLNLRYHQATTLSDMLLKGSDKWNEKLRIYANYVDANGNLGRGLNEDLKDDLYGIAYIAAPTRAVKEFPNLKIIPVAQTAAGPFVEYTMENLHSHQYPLTDSVYFYANALPGKGIDPRVKEFLRYVLSQEGQADIMRDGKYLPLTPEIAARELAKLNAAPVASIATIPTTTAEASTK